MGWVAVAPTRRPSAAATDGGMHGGEFIADDRLGLPASVQLDGPEMSLSCHDGSHADALRPALAALRRLGRPESAAVQAGRCAPQGAPVAAAPRRASRVSGQPG